jgi:hypothetical protein
MKALIEVHCPFSKDQPRIAYLPLYAWDGDNAPRREKDHPYIVCVLAADLSNVPLEEFICRNGVASNLIYIANFKIEITLEGCVLDFRLLFGDKLIGSVRGDYT